MPTEPRQFAGPGKPPGRQVLRIQAAAVETAAAPRRPQTRLQTPTPFQASPTASSA
jgi:hypothetical protein